ncbi:unnamed protein product [Tenebrio molitor]|nr:unnamed protein product [Tenebrio molitor]
MQNRAAMRFLRVESAAFKIYRRCRLFLPRSNLLLSIMSSKNPKSCSLGSRQTFTHLGVVFQKGCNCLGVNTYHVERSVIQMTCLYNKQNRCSNRNQQVSNIPNTANVANNYYYHFEFVQTERLRAEHSIEILLQQKRSYKHLHENFMTKNILKTNISKHRRLKRVLIMKRVLNKKL